MIERQEMRRWVANGREKLQPPKSKDSRGYPIFLLRAAQRFFIASDKRLRPSGLIPRRRRPVLRPLAERVFLAEPIPINDSIALPMRSLSTLKSDKIF